MDSPTQEKADDTKQSWDNTQQEESETDSASNASDEGHHDAQYAGLKRNDNFEYLKKNRPGRFVLLRNNKRPNRENQRFSVDDENEAQNKKNEPSKSEVTGKDKVSGAQLKSFPEGLNPSARRNEWILWREQLMLTLSLKPSLKSQEEKLAFLVVSGGKEIQKAIKNKPSKGERLDIEPIPVFDNILKRLDFYFNTGTNAITDIIAFRKIGQRKNEQFISFVNRLQEQASYCGFGDSEENQIMMQIREGAKHKQKLGEMMTRENKSLSDVINYGSSLDTEDTFEEGKLKIKKEETRDTDSDEEKEAVAYVQKPFNKRREDSKQERFQPYHDYHRGRERSSRPIFRNRDQNAGRQVCYNCNRPGHIARNCRSFQRPPRNSNVAFVKENKVRKWME